MIVFKYHRDMSRQLYMVTDSDWKQMPKIDVVM